MPKRKKDGSFTLDQLPPGNYHVFYHLIGTIRHFGRSNLQLSDPTDAWGGVPLSLHAHQTTVLQDLAEPELGSLTVRVTDAAGKPVNGARLSILDRMKQWSQSFRKRYAPMHDLPTSPTVVLEHGLATLPSIRAGRLELQIGFADGRVLSCCREVRPGTVLDLLVPWPVE